MTEIFESVCGALLLVLGAMSWWQALLTIKKLLYCSDMQPCKHCGHAKKTDGKEICISKMLEFFRRAH